MLFLSRFVMFSCESGYMWSPAGKRLASWLSLVMSNCEVVTSPFVSLARCVA